MLAGETNDPTADQQGETGDVHDSESNKSQESDDVLSPAEKIRERGTKRKRDYTKQGNKYDRLVAAVDSAREVEIMQDLCETVKAATAERTKN